MKGIAKVMMFCAALVAGTATLGAGGNELATAALRGDLGTLAMELSVGSSLPAMIQAKALSPAVLQVVLAVTEADRAGRQTAIAYAASEIADRFAFTAAVAWQVARVAEPAARLVGQETAATRFEAMVLAAAGRGDFPQLAALLACGTRAGGQSPCDVLKAAQVALGSGHQEAAALLVAYEAGRRAALN